ncbi:MAG: CpsD/CapB family tyrosine-protein kinase [Ruminococcus sp.]
MKKIQLDIPALPYEVEEAMNRLRVNVKFCGKNTKKILITSSVPNEGKSVISVQLWKMMAEAGFKTVLLDVDLRKSLLKERHNYSADGDIKGLNYYLSGLTEYEDVVYETNVENGYIIPSINPLENPLSLFEDTRFSELLDKLSEEYRYVLIDSPPLCSVADGSLVASMCDGALLVVRSGTTSKELVRQSIKQLDYVGCKLLGTVLNRAETGSRSYNKYYGKYYGTSQNKKTTN